MTLIFSYLTIRGESQAELTAGCHFANVHALQRFDDFGSVLACRITMPQLTLVTGAK